MAVSRAIAMAQTASLLMAVPTHAQVPAHAQNRGTQSEPRDGLRGNQSERADPHWGDSQLQMSELYSQPIREQLGRDEDKKASVSTL